MLTTQRRPRTVPATELEIRIPIGEYRIGNYSFFEALLDITEINHSPQRLVAYAFWNMKKPYPKHYQPLDFGILEVNDPIAQIALICAPPLKGHNQELIIYTDYSARLIVNVHVTLDFKPNTFLISPNEHWRFQ